MTFKQFLLLLAGANFQGALTSALNGLPWLVLIGVGIGLYMLYLGLEKD